VWRLRHDALRRFPFFEVEHAGGGPLQRGMRAPRELFVGAARSLIIQITPAFSQLEILYMLVATRTCIAVVALLAAACGGGMATSPSTPTPPSSSATVQATPALQFTPANVNLAVGGTVTFAFGSVDHNVYFDNAPVGAPTNITAPTSNASLTRTFPTAGRFVYNCHLHPGMSGTIVVQ
jgi:plastocyanin